MVNRLLALAFLLALGSASSAAAQTTCWYCECDGSRCYCVQIPCDGASATNDSLFSRILATAPVGAEAILIQGPSQLEDGSFRWNLVWANERGDFLGSAGFSTSYQGAQQVGRKLASQRGVELIDKTREK